MSGYALAAYQRDEWIGVVVMVFTPNLEELGSNLVSDIVILTEVYRGFCQSL